MFHSKALPSLIVFLVLFSILAILTESHPGSAIRAAGVTPTHLTTSTPLPEPGSTATATPVDRDYVPAVFGLNITPTATQIAPIVTSTFGPISTPPPPPG